MNKQTDMFNVVTIDGIMLLKETENAILIAYDNEEHWLPKSQIEAWDDDSVTISEWIAEQKGII